MADYGFDGMIKVSWVPTIANIAAPTVAELNAGTSLEGRLLPDGLATPAETAAIVNSKMNSTYDTEIVGRRKISGLMVKYVRGDGVNDLAVEAALIYKALGNLVVRRNLVSTAAYAAAQKVEVYPAQVDEPNPDSPGPNTLQAVSVGFKSTADPRGYSNPATVSV